jgi:hypothetical protein
MKTRLICCCIGFISATIMVSSCSSSKSNSESDLAQTLAWQKDSLVIDGDDGDWTKALTYHIEKLGLAYSISNDKDNLYILASTNNETTIQRILRAGLTVYLNSHGVKDEASAAGISFPTGNRVKKDGQILNDRPELQQNKHLALSAVQDYSLFGFHRVKAAENFDYGKANADGIELGIGLNSANALVYELMIPLNSFLNKNELSIASRKSFAIEFVLETIPGEPGSEGGGGGISFGGGVGVGSYGNSGGVGVSVGSGNLATIGGGKKAKPFKIWKELYLARTAVATK